MSGALPGISRFSNRLALVTGASCGIGLAICKALVPHGINVVGVARNIEQIDVVAEECRRLGFKGEIHSYKCDISKENQIEDMFSWIKSRFGGVDVCVNSAGFSNDKALLDITAEEMRAMLDVNVVGLTICTQLSVKSMLERNVDDGHIFNLNSMSGHRLTSILHFYAATKFAVTALTEGFRRELVGRNTRIRITSISPGLVKTEFLGRALGEKRAEQVFSRVTNVMAPEDIANTLVFALSSPENVQVHDILMRPTGEEV